MTGETETRLTESVSAQVTERIEIAVERKTGWIRESTVFDLLGNETHLAFSDLETNAPAPPERFRFDPPAGVRVLKLDSGAQ